MAQRRREVIREDRLERAGMKKGKNQRDGDRDISEKIALGQAQPSTKGEAMFDQRLFNDTIALIGQYYKIDGELKLLLSKL